ncbi:MaoC family dehydratase [Methylocella sp.]|uniref:MaoC family dehydratase n=1 Tax=Methylocella sp. TaxID=1978226 RepID=UPI0035B3B387
MGALIDDARSVETGERIGEHWFGPIDAARLCAYALASGDDNPLHLDPAVAVAAGLDAPPVHGVLMMSLFEPALRRWRPGVEILRLSAKFLRPIAVGGAVRVTGRVARAPAAPGDEMLLRVTAHGENGELAVLGEVSARDDLAK